MTRVRARLWGDRERASAFEKAPPPLFCVVLPCAAKTLERLGQLIVDAHANAAEGEERHRIPGRWSTIPIASDAVRAGLGVALFRRRGTAWSVVIAGM